MAETDPAPFPEVASTFADVMSAFRLMLGREASVADLTERTSQPLASLLRDLAASPEHREFVRTPLLSGTPFVGRFRSPPSTEDAAWLQRLTPDASLTATEATSWRALLRRAWIRLRMEPPPTAPDEPEQLEHSAAPAGRSGVEAAFQLLLGRTVNDEETLANFEGMGSEALATAVLASDEFGARVVADASEGRLGEDGPPPIGVVRWLREGFGADVSAFATRGELIARVLGSPRVTAALETARLGWSPAALAEMLAAQAALAAIDRARPRLVDRLQRLSRGVEILSAQDMELGDAGVVRFTSPDPAVIFRLSAELMTAPAVELAFTVAGARRGAPGALYLDYGEGMVEAARIPLTPTRPRVRHAIVMHPSRVSLLRWDPDDRPGEAFVVSIGARALANAELEARFAGLSLSELMGADVVERSRPSADAALSRSITQHAFDHGGGDYADWIAEHEPEPGEAQRVWAGELATLARRPRIAVLVPLYNTPGPLLREMVESVLAQVYPDWELCLADDASPEPHVRAIVEAYVAADPRIHAVFRKTNGHISEASNSALELVTADWVALLDHDDLLAPDALLAVAGEINRHPEARFIYSDEDKIDAAGRRFDVFFKPDFSPELLRSMNYLNHLSVHRTDAIRAAGGWRTGFEGSQDYDLNLRTLERLDPAQVRHIPKVLYHWRAIAGSTALAGGEKSYAVDAGLRALREHIARMQWEASADVLQGLPFYRVRYATPSPAPLVSVIVPTRDRADLLAVCVDSVLALTDYRAFEVVIADNGSIEPETFALFERLSSDPRVRLLDSPGPFNYSRINNNAARSSRGALLCLLNNDVEVISRGWLREMASWAAQARVGCVGAKLYFPNDTVQHAGVVLGLGGVAGHGHKHRGRNDPGYFGRIAVSHDVSAVTGACLMVRREVWDEVGGLDERLQVAFNDVDFCLRVRAAGYSNVFTPFAELYHHESISRGEDVEPEKRARFLSEVEFMQERWSEALSLDPFYSPNLSPVRDDYSLA